MTLRPVFVYLVVSGLACKAAPSSYKEVAGTQVSFDFAAELSSQDHFYDFPWPSDLRLDSGGHPDMRGFPNGSDNTLVTGLLATVTERLGFPVIASASFRFSAPVTAQDASTLIPADKTASLLLIDVDARSPTRGKLFTVAAYTPGVDDYTPANLLTVAPAPGIVLEPRRQYAYVIRRSLKDAAGAPLGIPLAFQALKNPLAAGAGDVSQLYITYQPLWTTLTQLGVSLDDVAAATVFTTGDVVQDLADLTTRLRDQYPMSIDPASLKLNPEGDTHPRFCELLGKITLPQFQKGAPPYDTDGRFVFGADGMPIKQADVTVPIAITLPKSDSPMPDKGFPLMVYVHGSGGRSTEMVDRGKTLTVGGLATPGEGPAHVVAAFGIAGASSAMPLNPERLPGATDYAYLNPNNLPSFPSTFRQGVVEQRMYIEALSKLEIDPASLGACQGVTLPAGASKFKFDFSRLVQMGQSMGAMYTNMIGATEPRVQAIVPSGAGGYWAYMILNTGLVPGQTLLTGLLGVQGPLQYLHPVLQLLEVVWESADPMVYMARVARRPLPGAPVRPIYEAVGTADAYFPEILLDAMALSYGNQEAGQPIWPTMQQTLALEGRDGLATYPVKQNRTSEAGGAYTGVVVQYAYDKILSGHNVTFQLDDVKYQYGCFLHSFISTGTAVVPAPAALGTPCPQ